MDWGVVLLLAAITWLEGVRRVPADAVVLRRVVGGGWAVVDLPAHVDGWQLVAWWSPLTLGLVVRAQFDGIGAPSAAKTLDARLAGASRGVAILRVLGALVLASIVVLAPTATTRYGVWGLSAAVAAALTLSIACALIAARAVSKLGHSPRRVARVSLPLLWPFSAPRAAEVVLEHVIDGMPQPVVVRRLLGDGGFGSWVRPRAYDALRSSATDGFGDALLATVGRPALATIVGAAPPSCGPDERFCARCARVYRTEVAACAECGGIALSVRAES